MLSCLCAQKCRMWYATKRHSMTKFSFAFLNWFKTCCLSIFSFPFGIHAAAFVTFSGAYLPLMNILSIIIFRKCAAILNSYFSSFLRSVPALIAADDRNSLICVLIHLCCYLRRQVDASVGTVCLVDRSAELASPVRVMKSDPTVERHPVL